MDLARLSFVTGKGGTGKSTVAAAIALATADCTDDKRSLLADLDGRLSAARMLGLSELSSKGASHRTSNGGPPRGDAKIDANVDAQIESIVVTGRGELEAFVKRFVPLKAISRRMLRSRSFGYVGAAAPGLAAFLTMERLRLIAGEAALKDRYAVVDAPSSGGALELLGVAGGVRDMAPFGTLNRLAGGIEGMLIDPHRFGVIVTVAPEEPALREAVESVHRVRGFGITNVSAVLNCVVDDLFDDREMARINPLKGHGELARRRRAMAGRTAETRDALAREKIDFIELPMLFRPAIGRREAAMLAVAIKRQIRRP